MRRLDAGERVVDLSADFRLRSAEEYKNWYGVDHPAPELLSEAVYGLPELHRAEMASARLVSGVGCNATSAITALLPLARAGLIEEARIECRVGSSEAGANADEGSAHAMRSRALRVVNPFVHRHMAEVVQELSRDYTTKRQNVHSRAAYISVKFAILKSSTKIERVSSTRRGAASSASPM